MKQQGWFKSPGTFYLPGHPAGYVVTFMSILFMLPVVMSIFRNGHSVSNNFFELFVYGTCIASWWKWIAEKKS
jgi:hypothetical protein